jgi:hypothetical protein
VVLVPVIAGRDAKVGRVTRRYWKAQIAAIFRLNVKVNTDTAGVLRFTVPKKIVNVALAGINLNK